MPDAHLKVFRGRPGEPSAFVDFDVPVEEGMVVLDALHWIQGHRAPDLAVRWNCKAAKCGSGGAEVNGRPSLTCKTRLTDYDLDEPITVEPMRAFPLIKDLVTDVSWNYAVNKTIEPFSPPADVPQADWRWQQRDVERVQEFRKCIECFLCQDVCHVLRNHETDSAFMGPRFLVRAAGLEMHPMDQGNRRDPRAAAGDPAPSDPAPAAAEGPVARADGPAAGARRPRRSRTSEPKPSPPAVGGEAARPPRRRRDRGTS